MTAILQQRSPGASPGSGKDTRRLRIAWICPFLPDPKFGGAVRCYHLIRTAAMRHDVDVFVLEDHAPVPDGLLEGVRRIALFPSTMSWKAAKGVSALSPISHQRVATHSRSFAKAWRNIAGDYDAVVHEFTRCAWATPPGDAVRVLNMHNIEHELLLRTAASDSNSIRRVYRTWDGWKLSREERGAVQSFDLVATCSNREKEIVAAWPGTHTVCEFSNGVDIASFRNPGTETVGARTDLLFLGTMNYFPNEQAVLHFHENIWPLIKAKRPATTCRIVGVNPTPRIRALAAPGFEVNGGVDDVRPCYWNAGAMVVPLLSGSGTRLKILEAAGAGTPIVSTSIGAEGLEFRNCEHLLLADDPRSFAEACLRILDNPALGRQLADYAQQLAAEIYDWNAIGRSLCDAIERKVAEKGAHA